MLAILVESAQDTSGISGPHEFVSVWTEHCNLQIAGAFVSWLRAELLNSIFADLSVRFFHGNAPVLDHAVVHVRQE